MIPALVREADRPVAAGPQPHERALAQPREQVRDARERVEGIHGGGPDGDRTNDGSGHGGLPVSRSVRTMAGPRTPDILAPHAGSHSHCDHGGSAHRRARGARRANRARRPRAAAQDRARRPRVPGRLRPREGPEEGAAGDRDRARRRDPPSRGRETGAGRGGRVPELLSRPRARDPGPRGRPRDHARARRQGHRRAHQHQPEQGGPHRPPAQRRPRRRPRPRAAAPGISRRGAELPRRHGRAGRRRRRRPAPSAGRDDARGRAGGRAREPVSGRHREPEGVRLPLLGPLRRGRPHLRGAAGDEGLARRGPARDRGRRQRDRAHRGARRRGGRLGAPGDDGAPRHRLRRPARARATSCTRTSGRAPSRC